MIEWNTVKYIDCMDENEGLPSLPDKSVDLCLTDPPYNKRYKGTQWIKKRAFYSDNLTPDQYRKFCNSWFEQIIRISKYLIFTPGNENIWNYPQTNKIGFHYKIDSQGSCYFAHLNKVDVILSYGKLPIRFSRNIFINYVNKGKAPIWHSFLIHPCPKNHEIWYNIVNKLKPKSVIDPFLGSGTTAEVCTKLGIPWLGYEINEVYSQDINKRLKNCKKEPRQTELKL